MHCHLMPICNSDDATQSYSGNAEAHTNLVNHKINSLMNLDDIKQFAKSEKEFENLIQAVRIYSQD